MQHTCSLVPRLSWTKNGKERVLYCKRRKAGQDLGTRLTPCIQVLECNSVHRVMCVNEGWLRPYPNVLLHHQDFQVSSFNFPECLSLLCGVNLHTLWGQTLTLTRHLTTICISVIRSILMTFHVLSGREGIGTRGAVSSCFYQSQVWWTVIQLYWCCMPWEFCRL